jgi:hypothetical protein
VSAAPAPPLPRPLRLVPTAVVFLVRGRDAGYAASYRRFLDSYRTHPAGLPHDLVLLCKGFADPADQARVEADFAGLASRTLTVGDEGFDLGAYREAARRLDHARVLFLNGWSEILSEDWLLKLTLNLDRPGIGLVGCTGCYEVLRIDRRFGPFPNPHVRSNGFLMDRGLFLEAIGERPIGTKLDAFLIESGPDSITRRVVGRGLGALLVGRDGRGFPPRLWPRSRTFRLGLRDNLMVADNQTRAAAGWSWRVLTRVQTQTWGRYLAELPPAGLDGPLA